jgi:multidrug efflux pump subunit AcrA (membrane-fusion protein)
VRIYVNVPQGFLGELAPGVHATLRLPGLKETFEAEMASTSNSLAESSRTALIELQADNADGKLWPGAFAEVHFHIPTDANALSVPLTALVFGQRGMQVAVIDSSSSRVTLKPVRLGRNLGNRVEIESGVSLSDRLIDNPPESMQTGDAVRLAATDAGAATTASNAKAVPTAFRHD